MRVRINLKNGKSITVDGSLPVSHMITYANFFNKAFQEADTAQICLDGGRDDANPSQEVQTSYNWNEIYSIEFIVDDGEAKEYQLVVINNDDEECIYNINLTPMGVRDFIKCMSNVLLEEDNFCIASGGLEIERNNIKFMTLKDETGEIIKSFKEVR